MNPLIRNIVSIGILLLFVGCLHKGEAKKNYLTVTYFNGDTEQVVIETQFEIRLEDGELSRIPLQSTDRRVIRNSVVSYVVDSTATINTLYIDGAPEGEPIGDITIKEK